MIIDHLITPFKYGKPVLTGSGVEGTFNSRAVDCPTVFRHNGQFYMMYFGFDGTGYQTALAVSDDLLHWTHRTVILPRGSKRGWDSVGMGATAFPPDCRLCGSSYCELCKGRRRGSSE